MYIYISFHFPRSQKNVHVHITCIHVRDHMNNKKKRKSRPSHSYVMAKLCNTVQEFTKCVCVTKRICDIGRQRLVLNMFRIKI